MATERIERLINPDVLTTFEQLQQLVDANVAGFERLVAAGVELNTSIGKAKTFKDFNEEITKLKANEAALATQVSELTATMVAYNKKQTEGNAITNDLQKAKKRLTDSYSTEARELSQVREQQLLVNKANKQSAQETLGLVDAYRQLELEYTKAERAARNLTIQYGANSKEAKEAIELAQQLDARLKEADYSVGKFGRNVGNYGSALKTLETYLADVRKELVSTKAAASGGLQISLPPAGPAASGTRAPNGPVRGAGDQAALSMVKYSKATADATDRVTDLSKQEQLLSRIVESQIAGYASATAEVKSNEKALQALGAAGLQNTEFYKALLADTARLKDSVGDLKDEIKALASDTRQFDLVAGAITGLVNVFQIGIGTAALFGDSGEDVQKSIERLTAVQNIAQGVQQLANDLTTKGTALNKLYNFVMGEGAAVKEVNTVATVESTIATEAQTIATEGATVATAGLSVGMKVLRGALAASGIGLLIVGIVYLLGKLEEWSHADLNLIKRQAELNGVLLETLRLNKELGELTRTDIGTEIQGMKNRIAANQAYGRSQGEILAGEKELATARRDAATFKFFDTGGFGNEGKLKKDLDDAAAAYKEFIRNQAAVDPGQRNDEIEAAQKELLQSNLDLAKEAFAEQKQINEDYVTANNDLTDKELQIARLGADEKRKLILESATLTANGIIDANQRVLENDKSTLEQRLQAVKNIAQQQKVITSAAATNERNDPSISRNPKLVQLARRQEQAALKKITTDGEIQQLKIKDDYRKRDAQAQLTSTESFLNGFIKMNDDIKNNEEKNLSDRLAAAKDSLDTQEFLINDQKKLELKTAGLTAKERQAIEDSANAKILEGRVQFTKDVNEITLQALEKQGDIRLSKATKDSDEEQTILNSRFAQGLLTVEQYQREKLKLENKIGALSLAVQLENIDLLIAEYKKQGKDVTELEAEVAAKRKEISDNLTEDLLKNEQAVRDKQIEFQKELSDLFISIDEASIEREQNKLDRESEQVDIRKERETDFVNQTITDQQTKADALAVIDAKAQRDKEVIAQKQQKLDEQKARTAKIIAVAQIIGDTAQTVFKLSADSALATAQGNVLLSNPLTAAYAPIAFANAAAIGAQIPLVIGLGAINAAKALGTKAFRFGGTTSEDAPILVGDNFQSEYMVNKEGLITKTPAVPTILMAEADTTIYPNKQSLEAGIIGNPYTAPILTDTATHYRYMTDKLGGKIDRLTKTVKEKKETHLHLRKGGWDIIKNEGGQQSDYLTNSLR